MIILYSVRFFFQRSKLQKIGSIRIINTIGDLTILATSQNIIKSTVLLDKPQLFIGSLERSRRTESETSGTFEKKTFW